MDYYQIGQRIRKYRKAHGMSQEQLAERIGISVTHMSHIETGNTKLSLPVFVEISQALGIHTDDLLTERTGLTEHANLRRTALDELVEMLECCSAMHMRIIADVAKSTKIALEKHMAG